MKEQYENLYAHLQKVAQKSLKIQKELYKAELEESWIKLKFALENEAKTGSSFIIIERLLPCHPKKDGFYYDNILLDEYKEIIWRLKILGFSKDCFSVTEKEGIAMKLVINWR